MMYRKYLILFLSLVLTSGYGQDLESMCINSNSIPFIDRIDSLEYYANKLSSEKSVLTYDKYERKFFQYFPCSFSLFDSIYGFDDILGLSPLYYKAYDHISKIVFNLKSVDPELFARKMISISIEGAWKADAVSYFQHELRRNVLKNVDFYCGVLSEYSEEDIYSFWKFLFESPHPENLKEEFDELYKEVDAISSNLAKILLKAVE